MMNGMEKIKNKKKGMEKMSNVKTPAFAEAASRRQAKSK
jgi:hypothetical protein